jgi:putative oxidoreductase
MLDRFRAEWAPSVLSLLRFMSGLLFLQHGTAKYLNFPHVAAFDNMTWSSMVGLGGVVEFITGALLTVGLFTPIAAFFASGEMAVAYFTTWVPRSFVPILTPGGDLAVLYCFVFFYLIFAGGGPWSLDALLKRNKT